MTTEDQEACEFEILVADRAAALVTAVACTAFVLLLIWVALYAPPSNVGQWPWLIGLILSISGGGLWSWIQFRRLRSRYRVTDSGLFWLQPGSGVVEIPWSDVESIRDHAIREFLEVRGTGRRVIRIEHSVVAYNQLREIIDLETEAHGRGAA